MNLFSKIIQNDNAIKAIFDHFRNIGISATVMAAASYMYSHPASGWLYYVSNASAVMLGILGLLLFALAERHGQRKISEANLPIFVHSLLIVMYGMSLAPLAVTLIERASR